MKKFLIVGCGGSGGATLRYLMDQLRADLRPYGIDQIPSAWQFIHIDVPPSPEGTKGLGSVRDLGGRYLSVSSPGNSYTLVANNVEQALSVNGGLRGLLGWAPSPKESAASVPVSDGAGQYRAVGRMLTLTDLNDIRAEFDRAWTELQRPDAWGPLPHVDYPGTFDADAGVIPMVVGSMAGGSGASMFLDVCRLLGRVPGLPRTSLGAFLYSADVFSSLPESARTGVDGNALGAVGEIISAQTRASDELDRQLFDALGIAPEPVDEPAFARVFPIGSSIGGEGAKFGDGSAQGVFRGLGRALAATMLSEPATEAYIKSKVENPNPPTMNRDSLGWGTNAAVFSWGSFGYASLSLGRDRYAEYASQRIARVGTDRLLEGHLNMQNQLPANEQLNALVEAQFTTILDRLRYPRVGSDIRQWFLTVALPDDTLTNEARVAVSEAMGALGASGSGPAPVWLATIRDNLPHFQAGASQRVRDSSYSWANGWAQRLETDVREEFLRAATQLGLPYAVAVVRRLASHLNPIIDMMRSAAPMGDPLMIDGATTQTAIGLKRTVIGAGHAVADMITRGYINGAKHALELESARLAGEVLSSFAQDVLGGLEKAGEAALVDLTAARGATSGQAGLAQLATSVYTEWPQDTDLVPQRFDQADNEVLLTTSADFPAQFTNDVVSSVPESGGVYRSARDAIVSEVLIGRWQTTGGVRGDFTVLTERVTWRAGALPKDPVSQTPTPKSVPVYDIAVRPADLLDRSRAHLRRPDQPFEKFSNETIEDWLNDPAAPDSVRGKRVGELVGKFRETMSLAKPLVGVSPPMIQKLHPGYSLAYEYTFSDIPVSAGHPAAQQILALVQSDATLDNATEDALKGAFRDNSTTNRIALFGSYPKYSPLVFSSLLDQIDKRFTGAPEIALPDLWRWKRTRPLPASLAMGQAEMSAMIRGWWLGRLLGAVVTPERSNRTDPAQVWDFTGSRWLEFPRRMLTAPARFRGPDDWLPAVLESHSLAVVRCNGDVNLQALMPYTALRRIYDETQEAPHTGFGSTVAEGRITDWLRTGLSASRVASPVLDPAIVSAPGATPEARAEAARAWLGAVADYIGTQYLTAGAGVGAMATRRVRIGSIQELAAAPMFTEIAELALDAVGALDELVGSALAAATAIPGPMQGGESGGYRPTF